MELANTETITPTVLTMPTLVATGTLAVRLITAEHTITHGNSILNAGAVLAGQTEAGICVVLTSFPGKLWRAGTAEVVSLFYGLAGPTVLTWIAGTHIKRHCAVYTGVV